VILIVEIETQPCLFCCASRFWARKRPVDSASSKKEQRRLTWQRGYAHSGTFSANEMQTTNRLLPHGFNGMQCDECEWLPCRSRLFLAVPPSCLRRELLGASEHEICGRGVCKTEGSRGRRIAHGLPHVRPEHERSEGCNHSLDRRNAVDMNLDPCCEKTEGLPHCPDLSNLVCC